MNWKNIITDLRNAGMTQPEIAAEIGCCQSFVSDLNSGKRGKRLGYAIGEKLMRLHRQRTNPQDRAA